MAYLQNEQILKILQKGNLPEELESCRKHDIRAKFHTETTLSLSDIPYRQHFIDWVGTIINSKKLEVFEHLMTLPVETIEFTEGVFDELSKIFEAQDRFIGADFTNPELSVDFNSYRKEIEDDKFWQTRGFQAMKSQINSIAVIDLPVMQDENDRFPRPYYYLLDVQKVRDFRLGKNYKFEYLIFLNMKNDDIAHALDDGHFRTYTKDDNGRWQLYSENPHDLKYTPARSFWSTPWDSRAKLQKRGPQSNSLGRLDWLLFLYTSQKHTELYAGFPVDVMYEQRCDYKDADGNVCENGRIRTTMNTSLDGSTPPRIVYDDCPNCKNKQLLGAGTVLTAPAMASNDDPDLLKGMNRISADKDSLEYLMNRIDKLESDISVNMIGYIAEGIREAMNREQVASMFESQVNCLAEVRDNFEAVHKFVLETMARLRYGDKSLISVTCNYGSKWFIHSVETLQSQYKEAKTNGFANFELSSQFEQILLTKYKNNPMMLERARTLAAIEPYQNYTVADLTALNEKFGLNMDLVRLKIDFSGYVNRFEREFMNIGNFMQFMPFNVKVAFIEEKLLQYVKEDYPEDVDPEPEPPEEV
jgi:hypothetical protein